MTKRKPGSTRPPRRDWTPEEVTKLEREYADRQTAELAAEFGCPESRVYSKAAKLGLHKSEAFMESDRSGRMQRGRNDPRMAATQFKAGNVSWNKGTKGIAGFHPNTQRTQFKKGLRYGKALKRYQPIGSLRVSKDGYLEEKVNDDLPLQHRWMAVHRLVWIEAHGPIPPKHVVCFLPGRHTADKAKITIDALELVSRADLAQRNHPRSKDPELAKLVQLKGAITRQVNRIAREAKENEHE